MGSVLVFTAPRAVAFAHEDDRPVGSREVRIRTLFSGISAGTELTAYRGTNPYLHKRWDAARRLFVAADQTSPAYPLLGWGYEEVGEIDEVGADVADLRAGQRIWGIWGHRTHHVVTDEYARARLLAPQLEPILGIFSRIGAIALNGILDAQINLGETVAVFGMGVVGQIVAQLARLSGARVVAVDLIPARLELARRLGADAVVDGREGSAAEAIKVERAVSRQVNCRARAWPRRTRSSRKSRSVSTRRAASKMRSSSVGSTVQAASPQTSGSEVTALVTTGAPAAIASRGGRPKPSARLAKRNRSACA